jgi:pimeloyl-ACP methyl ester carboxylesterase
MDTALETFDAVLPHGITLACRAAGPAGADAPRVLLLHGFPEAAFAWEGVMQRLQGRVCCVAPDLRGFGGSSAPADIGAYRAAVLMDDLEALIDRLGGPVDLLVAHDWGGALAWNLAAQRPALLRRLLIVNSPHPAAFLRELRHNPAQREASAYMNFLCRPDAAALLEQDGYARLWPFFERMGASAWLDEAMRERYRQVWACGLEGALNYYRASPLKPPLAGAPDRLARIELPDEAVTVRVPTTVLWGLDDTALLPGLLDSLDRWVPDLRTVRVSGASHWIVHERPDLVVAEIERALASRCAEWDPASGPPSDPAGVQPDLPNGSAGAARLRDVR